MNKKIAIILLIVAMAVTFVACNQYTDFEKRVIEDACKELEIPSDLVDGVELEELYREYVAWLDCEVVAYVMTLPNGKQYLVYARDTEDPYDFYCDVEGIYNGEFR